MDQQRQQGPQQNNAAQHGQLAQTGNQYCFENLRCHLEFQSGGKGIGKLMLDRILLDFEQIQQVIEKGTQCSDCDNKDTDQFDH